MNRVESERNCQNERSLTGDADFSFNYIHQLHGILTEVVINLLVILCSICKTFLY